MSGISTFADYQDLAASEKIGLCVVEASRRLMGWVLESGSIYKLTGFEHSVVVSIKDSGVAYVAAANLASVTAGKYYLDRAARILYLRASDSSNPNSRFLACLFRMFFATAGSVHQPYDIATGFDVEWLPLLRDKSQFGVGIDSQNQIGVAIEGSGSIEFENDLEFWKPRFDKFYFENQNVLLYSWNRELPITQARLIYQGRIQGKSWDTASVKFQVKDLLSELRNPVPLTDLGDVVGARIPDNLRLSKMRRVYGRLSGHRPTNIDQVLDGYPLTGTVSVVNGATTFTGTGTAFLAELTPGDTVQVEGAATTVTIKTVNSNTSCTLSEAFSGTSLTDEAATVRPSHPKRYANREFIVAGHALSEPVPTVTRVIGLNYIEVTDNSGFKTGDILLINGEQTVCNRISSGGGITFNTNLETAPAIGTVVKRLAITNAYLNDRKLTLTRDYTYDASLGTFSLDTLAEFNVAPTLLVAGTFTFTNTSRTVTGSGTFFTSTIKPGDWIKATAQSSWFEVLSVESDVSLSLRTAATYTATSAADLRSPEVYSEGDVILSVDVKGVTSDGTTTGSFLESAAPIVRDLLVQIGLTSILDEASFTTSAQISEAVLGFAIPERFNDTKTKTVRDILNKVNESVFGSLIQNSSFQLAYNVLRPRRGTTAKVLREFDVLKLVVQTKSDKIVKTVKIEYAAKEFDPGVLAANSSSVAATNRSAQYLANTSKEQIVSTYLAEDRAAEIHAYRWAFLFSSAVAAIDIETKLQGIDLNVGDAVELFHEKIYERIGSSMSRKVAAVQSIERSISGSGVTINDLGNSFSRCGAITPNDARSYDDASDSERALYGYITDTYGMMSNDPASFGVNLIW